MAVPWLQIVQLVPSIVDVSRELLKKTKPTGPAAGGPPSVVGGDVSELAHRIAALEENERRQAELVNKMAEQLARLAEAVTVLHRRMVWVGVAAAGALVLACIALLLAVSR